MLKLVVRRLKNSKEIYGRSGGALQDERQRCALHGRRCDQTRCATNRRGVHILTYARAIWVSAACYGLPAPISHHKAPYMTNLRKDPCLGPGAEHKEPKIGAVQKTDSRDSG